MSERTVRLCDVSTENGICTAPFEMVCPLCQRDVCSYHKGNQPLGPYIRVTHASGEAILGFCYEFVCRSCADALAILPSEMTNAFGKLARSIQQAVLDTARATLAEHKLKKSAK